MLQVYGCILYALIKRRYHLLIRHATTVVRIIDKCDIWIYHSSSIIINITNFRLIPKFTLFGMTGFRQQLLSQ